MEKENTEQQQQQQPEEVDVQDLFWDTIRLQRRADDLESTLAHVLQGLVEAETREERLAAVEIADVLPTIRVHRGRLSA